ncbi:MAG: riboflavin synthase [Elusimicrobiota bacterium]|jgi:riboflavin synthase
MFTGIILKLGRVVSNTGYRLRVDTGLPKQKRGASVAVNGVCLTSVGQKGGVLDFDVSPETLSLTNLGELKPKDAVNIEPSMKAGDSIGGHWVSGHVDARAKVLEREDLEQGFTRIRFELPSAMRELCAYKGSIAIDGTSMTVTRVGRDFFETVAIPETLDRTTLGRKKTGGIVNLEADMFARYLLNALKTLDLRSLLGKPAAGRAAKESAVDIVSRYRGS